MTKHPQNRASFTRMCGDGNDLSRVGREDAVERDLGAIVLRRGRLGRDAVPVLVVFGKGGLDVVSGEEVVDVGFVAAVVAGVGADALAEELLDGWHKGVIGG